MFEGEVVEIPQTRARCFVILCMPTELFDDMTHATSHDQMMPFFSTKAVMIKDDDDDFFGKLWPLDFILNLLSGIMIFSLFPTMSLLKAEGFIKKGSLFGASCLSGFIFYGLK